MRQEQQTADCHQRCSIWMKLEEVLGAKLAKVSHSDEGTGLEAPVSGR